MPRHGNILVSRTLCEFFNIDRFSGEPTIDIDFCNRFQTFGQLPSANIALGAKYFEHSSHQGIRLL